MGVLSHLFSSWGIILQVLAVVHLVRRGGAYFWFFIIIMGGYIGAIAYILVEVLPDAYVLKELFVGAERKKQISLLEAKIVDNPSPANFEELAELYYDEKQYPKAREAYDRAISTRSDSLHTFYHRALCALEMKDYPAAIADLQYVVHKDPDFDYYRASALLAHTYAQAGHNEQAAALFADVAQHSTIPETWYNYACFLKSQNRTAEAREWAQKIFEKKRTMPRFAQRRERPWFAKAKALLKALPAA